MIIPAYADEDLTKNYDPHKNQSKKLEDLFSQPPQDNALSLLQKNEAETPSVSVDAGGATLNAARKARAVFEAKLKELEFKERQGAMIDKRRVYKALFEMGQEMRTAILAIPDRIVDEMMASSTRHEAHTILYKALQSELEKFADFASRDIAISR